MTSSWMIVLLLGAAWTVHGNFIDTIEQAKDDLSQVEYMQTGMYDEYYDDSEVNTEYDSNYDQYDSNDDEYMYDSGEDQHIQKDLYDEYYEDSEVNTEYDSNYDQYDSNYDEYMYDSGENQYEYEEPGMYYDTYDDDSMYYDSYEDYFADYKDVMLNETEIAAVTSDIENTLEQSLVGRCSRGTCSYCLKIWKLHLCAIARLSGNRLFFSIKFNRRTLFRRSISAKGRYTININKRLFGGFRHLMKSNLKIKLSGINLSKKRFCVQAEVRIRFFRRPLRVPRHPKCFHL